MNKQDGTKILIELYRLDQNAMNLYRMAQAQLHQLQQREYLYQLMLLIKR